MPLLPLCDNIMRKSKVDSIIEDKVGYILDIYFLEFRLKSVEIWARQTIQFWKIHILFSHMIQRGRNLNLFTLFLVHHFSCLHDSRQQKSGGDRMYREQKGKFI